MRALQARALLAALIVAGPALPARATTPHPITIDGTLLDFATDEKTAGDAVGDSVYGANNELSTLYVTWDAQKLYLGFEYQAEQTAVMLLVETGKTGGVTSFCKSAGYNGAFPANVKGPELDLLLAFFAPADPKVPSTPYVYTLGANASVDVTGSPGVVLKLAETVGATGRTGALEAALPWSLLYPGLGGKVPTGGQLQLALVLRGKNDDDGLGDAAPDPTGGVKKDPCGGASVTVIDKLFQVSLDADGDGTPDSGWSPGTNGPKTDGGPPKPLDSGPGKDLPPPDSHAAADLPASADASPGADGPVTDGSPTAGEAGAAERGAGEAKKSADQRLPDAGRKAGQNEGCACAVLAAEPPFPLAVILLTTALILPLAWRRRPR